MQLAKEQIDIGLYTNQRDAQLQFWQETVGLAYDHMAKLGGGVQQHRLVAHGSIVKINHTREPLPAATPSGLSELLIAREGLEAPVSLTDPDGNAVQLVPPGHRMIVGIGVRLKVSDRSAAARFYRDALQMDEVGGGLYQSGDSMLLIEQAASPIRMGAMLGLGFRYLTIQVQDCDAAHAGILRRGGTEGRPPVTLGDTARISFVRDPDGNWIEISERASVTGRSVVR